VSGLQALAPGVYRRQRPETTALYEVVRDNLETLYGTIGDGAIAVRIPKHARRELEAYLDCGLLCRGFARLRCQGCGESRLVAFSCKGRGFCPSCLGRRMNATAADLMERVLPPQSGLAPVGVDLPVLLETTAGPGRGAPAQAHAPGGGDGAGLLRRAGG
jgi:transposase-like zinc-binding protein